MTWLFLEPSDVWLFRDGRPFAAGEGHAAQTIYPPTPFTVQGALRSHLLGREAVDWRAFAEQSTPEARRMAEVIGHPPRDGTPASLGRFALRGPFRAQLSENDEAEIFYPPPRDVYFTAAESWQALRPARAGGPSNWPAGELHLLLPDPKHPRHASPREPGSAIEYGAMERYLTGQNFGMRPEPEDKRETRLGIAVDYAAGRAADQMLYLAEFARLDQKATQHGLLVELADAIDWPEMTVIALGGEARAAHVRRLTAGQAPGPLPSATGTRLKIVLLTPAWFDGGWRPADGDWARLLGAPPEAKVRCVAAAVGRPQYIGGWAVAAGREGHKPLRGFAPPGSVYYFEAERPIGAPPAFTDTPAGEPSFASQGFGVCVAGAWDWLDQPGMAGQPKEN